MEITGRLVADATVRTTGTGKELTGFRVAVSRRYVSQGQQWEETVYVNCTYWRTGAIAPYLTKGMAVHLQGFMSAHAWLNKAGEAKAELDFRVAELEMLTSSRKDPSPGKGSGKAKQAGDPKGVMQPSEQFN